MTAIPSDPPGSVQRPGVTPVRIMSWCQECNDGRGKAWYRDAGKYERIPRTVRNRPCPKHQQPEGMSEVTTTAPDAPEQDFAFPSQLSGSPGGSGDDDPGYVPGVDLDRWNRYLLPIPGGDPTDLQPYTRVTTLTGMLTSQDGLRVWSERNIVQGIGMRPDLRAAAATAITDRPEDKAIQDDVIRVAKEVTRDGAAARYGRAVHRAIEDWSVTGKLPDNISWDEELGRDALAAIGCLEQNGIRVRMVERLVVHSMCRFAGRLDALWEYTRPDGTTVLRVGDVKTGKDLHKPEKRHPIGAQLGGYVNAEFMYEPSNRTFQPMPPELDRSVGYVLAVRNGTAQLYEIDLIAGWQRMLTAVKLHQDRKASVDMLPVGQPVTIQYAEPAPEAPAWTPAPRSDGHTDQCQPECAHIVVADVPLAGATSEVGAHWSPGEHDGGSGLQIPHAAAAVVAGVLGEEFRPGHTPVRESSGDDAAEDLGLSPSGRKRRACSKCRRPGHTAKRCPGVPADAQPGDSAVDDGGEPTEAELVKAAVLCPHAHGWTRRESDGAWVCVDCGRPSEATVEAMRTGEPLPINVPAQPLPPAVESGATVARLDPAPASPPPWTLPPATPAEGLMRELKNVTSQEALGQLWQANQAIWGPEHTARAQAMVDAGLPILPPS